MSNTRTLIVDIQGLWHAGSGRTSGSHVDLTVEKDRFGLPFSGGKHLAGLIRDAIDRAECWGWYQREDNNGGTPLESLLFGTRTDADDENRFATEPGVLMVSDARLPSEEHAYLAQQAPGVDAEIASKVIAMREGLYRSLFSTAIDHRTGTAKTNSLRGVEVTIPLRLEAELTCDHPDAELLFAYVKKALPLIDHIGGMRNRGLGRAELYFADDKERVV